jgi:hypothetical protein
MPCCSSTNLTNIRHHMVLVHWCSPAMPITPNRVRNFLQTSRWFHFHFLFPSLCGLAKFKTLYSVLNTCHFIKSSKPLHVSAWIGRLQVLKIVKNNVEPIAVAARSKARTVFARSNTEIVGSNPTGGMAVCVCSVCVYSVSTPCGGG